MNTVINATMREDQGKGASRRLRHNEQIPAIIYGAGKEPNTITLNLHEITHLLENEESYTSILDLTIDKKAQVLRPNTPSGGFYPKTTKNESLSETSTTNLVQGSYLDFSQNMKAKKALMLPATHQD
jgi:ribosomal protein L25 (general stress protein Ctc)